MQEQGYAFCPRFFGAFIGQFLSVSAGLMRPVILASFGQGSYSGDWSNGKASLHMDDGNVRAKKQRALELLCRLWGSKISLIIH
jgi:hypothetical protein